MYMHMKKQIGFLFTALLLLLEIKAQKPKNNPSPSLYQQFMQPPVTVRPYVWWHWMGSNFSKQGITKDLEAMKALGIGGATIFNLSSAVQESHVPTLNNPWPQQTYRSKAYWEAIQHAAAEAKRLGLEIGLHNTVGYSTTGGPWITEERAMKKLVWRKAIITNGSQNIQIAKPNSVINLNAWGRRNLPPIPSTWYKDIAYLAIAVKDSSLYKEVHNFSAHFDTSGALVKPLPKGDWIVYRMGYAPTMSNPHPAPDEIMTTCLEADKMNKEQSLFHWNTVLQPFKQKLAPYLGNSFKHMLIDSYEAGYQNWSPHFREDFIKIKGYDPLPWLLTMNNTVANNEKNPDKRIYLTKELSERFEWDYKDVISQLFYINGWQIGKQKLLEAGLQLQFEPYGGPFSMQEGAALADIPMGEFWTTHGGVSREIAAAGRAAGRTIIGAEAFTGSPGVSKYNEAPSMLKAAAQKAFAAGVNRMILHHWVHQPFSNAYQPGMGMGWWGTHFGRHQTWAEPGKAFFAYLSRTQTLLQYGQTASQILSLDWGYADADIIGVQNFLSQNIQVKDGIIELPSGRSYRLLLLPNIPVMLPQVAEKIEQLVKAGAIVVGNPPTKSPSAQNYPQCDSAIARISKTLWQQPNVTQVGKGKVYTNIKQALQALQITDDYTVVKADSAQFVKCIHRTGKEAEVFFVANLSKQPQFITVSLNVTGKVPEIWQAENATAVPATVWKQEGGRTLVTLHLNDFQSTFVVFRQPTLQKNATVTNVQVLEGNAQGIFWNQQSISTTMAKKMQLTYADGKSEVVQLANSTSKNVDTNWRVQLYPKLDSSFSIDVPYLRDLSTHADERVKYFAGKAVYTKQIQLAANQISDKNTIIDLGKLSAIAELSVNGQSVGVLWYPPYTADISKWLKPGTNTLTIAVTTTWANRLIGDEQEPADFEWGTDRGTNGKAMKAYPDWFVQNKPRPSVKRKTFSIWYYYNKTSPLQPAGLMGPVVLHFTKPHIW